MFALALSLLLIVPPAAATSRSITVEPSEVLRADRPPSDPLDPSALSPEIRAWLDGAVNRVGTDDERMRRILAALAARHMTYDNAVTGTAAETFTSGKFNCLSLAHLVVGLAREIGVDAYYVRIEEFRSYHQRGDLVMVSTHVAAGWGPRSHVQIVEFEQTTDRERRAAYEITDRQAVGLHYANRGAELLRVGWPALARAWLVAATELEPRGPEGWVNLGVAERRLGATDRAEAAYRRALDLDPDNLSAWRNLASLLERQGDPNAARKMLELLNRPGYRNPYTYLALGDLCRDGGAPDDAERFYRHAWRLDRRDPQILAARGEVALAEGDLESAASWLARARHQDPEEPRVNALAAALAAQGSETR